MQTNGKNTEQKKIFDVSAGLFIKQVYIQKLYSEIRESV